MRRLNLLSKNIFRAYDVRGEYPSEVNARVVETIARAVGQHLDTGTIVIAHDGRTSSPALAFAVSRGLTAARPRTDLLDLGLATTPMFYFFVASLHAAGGIMVTASHNPKEMNGLKVVGPGALPISGVEVGQFVKHAQNRRDAP